MKTYTLEIPSTLSEAEKIEYLKIAAEYWKNYYAALEKFASGNKICSAKSIARS